MSEHDGALSEGDLLAHFEKVKKAGRDKWMACCPAHDDRNPSLSISRGNKGWLLHCHAGCTFDAVLASAVLETGDLFDEPLRASPNRTSTNGRVIDTVYDYVNEDGELLFQTVRYKSGKPRFHQRRPDGNGDYTWKLGDARRVLYRLPRVRDAVAAGKPVYVVEGEKDVHALEQLGLVATTCPGGAGKWKVSYAESLGGAARIAIISDADEPGRKHALDVYRSLASVAGDVKLYEPAKGKDVSDHLAAGRSFTDLVEIKPEALPAMSNNGDAPAAATPANKGERLSLRTLASYTIRAVEWLDKPFIQRSAFHLLAGRKGSCKGTFLCGLAARVTTGQLYGEPKRVLVVTSEDSIELDFIPRLIAAGGNPELVEIVCGPFRMPGDLEWLKQKALELGNVGLIIIDPIGNHLGGADTDKEGQVRDAISPLNPLADELDCMVFGVRHLGKDVSRGALASVLGSTAWADVPREVILMAVDDENDLLYHAQVVAGNRGPRNSGRLYQLELVDVPPAVEITLLAPLGESTKNVEDLLGRKDTTAGSRSSQARELILDILEAEGDQESDALDARIAKEVVLKAVTVRNVRSQMRDEGLIKSVADKDEFGEILGWKVCRTAAPRGT